MNAGFADGFELAVELDGAGAVAVAEQPALHFDPQPTHLRTLSRSREDRVGRVVERFDLGGDSEILVGDFAVGDARVDQRHPQRLVADVQEQ